MDHADATMSRLESTKKTYVTEFELLSHLNKPVPSIGASSPTALTVTIRTDIDFLDPLIKLRWLELLPNTGQNMLELRNRDGAIGVLFENLEGVVKLFIERLSFHVLPHEFEKSSDIEGRDEILFGDDGLELGLGGEILRSVRSTNTWDMVFGV
ncbi:hypothetical protein G2W53_041850 [Senna tora]|uniref:Uncharacterized protein n=1 Tax=Senna tora TaxID=362788 RepID=A0A834SSR5_9FABA|nr:hypothetical protein G2W53_041850 [Senna tora]